MNKNIAIIGGDARYLELIRQLENVPNTRIMLVGYEKLERNFTKAKQLDFSDLNPTQLDIVILPITGTDEEGNVEVIFSNQKVMLTKTWFKELKKSTRIFTGISSNYLDNMTKQLKLKLTPLLERDDVAIYNSIPTAEATIMLAMKHTDYTIHSSRVIVSGFGRVGHTVANKFSALGAKVSVVANRIHDLARIEEMGLTAVHLSKLEENVSNCDILINTIPAKVIEKRHIQKLPSHALIFDLASSPGGTDFEYAKQRGIKAILAKSLPGVVAPKTAGKILANVIKQILRNGEELTDDV